MRKVQDLSYPINTAAQVAIRETAALLQTTESIDNTLDSFSEEAYQAYLEALG
jgi:hypothetical protein